MHSVGLGPCLPIAETVDPVDGVVWVACFPATELGNLTPIDPSTFATGASIPLHGEPVSASYDPGTGDVLTTIANASGPYAVSSSRFNATTGALVATLPATVVEGGAAWDPAGFLAVPNYANDELEALGGSPAGSVPLAQLGEGAYFSLYDPVNGEIYVVNLLGSSVSVVRIAAGLGGALLGVLVGVLLTRRQRPPPSPPAEPPKGAAT